jgi:hypothetical protein
MHIAVLPQLYVLRVTPAEAAGIKIEGQIKIITMMTANQNASKLKISHLG